MTYFSSRSSYQPFQQVGKKKGRVRNGYSYKAERDRVETERSRRSVVEPGGTKARHRRNRVRHSLQQLKIQFKSNRRPIALFSGMAYYCSAARPVTHTCDRSISQGQQHDCRSILSLSPSHFFSPPPLPFSLCIPRCIHSLSVSLSLPLPFCVFASLAAPPFCSYDMITSATCTSLCPLPLSLACHTSYLPRKMSPASAQICHSRWLVSLWIADVVRM